MKYEERAINAYETWYWRRILKIQVKWRDRITNDEVFFFKRRKRKDYF
jgi:hypothetical protein